MSFQPFILVLNECEWSTLHSHRLRVTFTKKVFLLKLNLCLKRWLNDKKHLLLLQMNWVQFILSCDSSYWGSNVLSPLTSKGNCGKWCSYKHAQDIHTYNLLKKQKKKKTTYKDVASIQLKLTESHSFEMLISC